MTDDEPISLDSKTASAGRSMRLQPGFVLMDRYEIKEVIGAGGTGELYRATDSRLDRDVAIKVLNVANLNDAHMQRRFDREVKSVASLSHANIVTLHDVATHDGFRFAVMELVQGKTLRSRITDELDLATTVKLAHGIALGILAAHTRNIVHRDIKPENVIVSGDFQAKILDFGLSKPELFSASQDLTSEGALPPGSAPYMSPEQVDGGTLSRSTDIFSFGTVLFEMLSGENPFLAENALQTMLKVSEAQPKLLAGLAGAVPAELVALVTRMLSHQPDERPTAEAVVSVLAHCASLMSDSTISLNSFQAVSAIPDHVPTNLPFCRVELTGRENEVKDVVSRLREHPIVTLVGPGGAGKTSLALEVARNTGEEYLGGVWFCEFAPLRDPKEVGDVIASALDGNAGSLSEMDQVTQRLQEQPTLLIFDNCEHVIDAAAELAETLTDRVANLTILATSRESLVVPGEYVSRLGGLPFHSSTSSAVDLFVGRAKSVAGYDDDPERRAVVQQIVARLEGLPLAIELAAPRLSAMSLEELLEALDDQMSTLRSARRSQGRQATVSQAISWSFDLLASDERQLLLSASVFAGQFTFEAAVAVSDTGSGSRRVLQRLVEQSVMVRTEHDGQSRFRLLEPIRQFGESIIEPELQALSQRRHAHFFASRAVELGKGIYGVDECRCATALNLEWPDLRKAIAWGRENSVIEVAIDPIVAMTRANMFHLRVEAFGWMAAAVEQFGAEAARRADVNYSLATGMWVMGDRGRARQHIDQSALLQMNAPNLYMEFAQLFAENRFAEAWDVIQRAREVAHANGDELESRWLSLPFAANTLTMVDPQDPRIDESLAASAPKIAKLDWPTGNAYVEMIQGTVAMTRGDLATAKQHMNQSIEISSSCGNRALAALVGMILSGFTDASVSATQRLESAVRHLRLMIDTGIETGLQDGDVSMYPTAVRTIIMALVQCGRLEDAARCFGIIDLLKGSGDQNELSPEFLPTIQKLAESLGQKEFDRLQSAGSDLTVADIAELGEKICESLS